MTSAIKIGVKNKALSERQRAEHKGELTEEKMTDRIIKIGFVNLAPYEKDYVKEEIAKKNGKMESEATDEDIIKYFKAVKTEYFKNLCDEKIVEGFTSSNGHFYRTNRDDQTNMIGQKDMLMESGASTLPWKTEDVGYVMHSKEEWLLIYQEAFAHKQTQLFKYDTIKRAIENAKNHEELHEIKWL